MRLNNIVLYNFRNYHYTNIKFGKGLNVFIGDNAQGKTNLIEAIYLLSFGQSFKSLKDSHLIRLNSTDARVKAEVEKKRETLEISLTFSKKQKKQFEINNIEIKKLKDFIGNVNVVLFSPDDLKLVKEGPSHRRKFIDSEISQVSPNYRNKLMCYHKILYQRNTLLKELQKKGRLIDSLQIWNLQLADYGAYLILKRKEFINKMVMLSRLIHRRITDGLEELDIKYDSSVEIGNLNQHKDIKKVFLEDLKKNFEEEYKRGTTIIGPHRDDIKIFINGTDVRTYGSQGQQRTAALSLKLAEIELIKSEVGDYPILLLDDVFSELDEKRRYHLLSYVKKIQTFLTTTHLSELAANLLPENSEFFVIQNGSIKRCLHGTFKVDS
ncbi:MAG: replication and repair protein RecF [Thermosediminibacterales bacterium]|nr:replication and repair protein RecF [Thermosediminibacterales bacterium]